MTPCQKIKREILLQAFESFKSEELDDSQTAEQAFVAAMEPGVTEETIDEQWYLLDATDCRGDYESEFRGGQVETKLPCEYSRHYESKAVARKLSDGTWVGWTYWYGGGKYGNPEEIEWMEDAYDLEVTETEKVVVVQEFKKV